MAQKFYLYFTHGIHGRMVAKLLSLFLNPREEYCFSASNVVTLAVLGKCISHPFPPTWHICVDVSIVIGGVSLCAVEGKISRCEGNSGNLVGAKH